MTLRRSSGAGSRQGSRRSTITIRLKDRDDLVARRAGALARKADLSRPDATLLGRAGIYCQPRSTKPNHRRRPADLPQGTTGASPSIARSSRSQAARPRGAPSPELAVIGDGALALLEGLEARATPRANRAVGQDRQRWLNKSSQVPPSQGCKGHLAGSGCHAETKRSGREGVRLLLGGLRTPSTTRPDGLPGQGPRGALLTFYEFPADVSLEALRTTDPIESTFTQLQEQGMPERTTALPWSRCASRQPGNRPRHRVSSDVGEKRSNEPPTSDNSSAAIDDFDMGRRGSRSHHSLTEARRKGSRLTLLASVIGPYMMARFSLGSTGRALDEDEMGASIRYHCKFAS